jgi:hypothetical protein
LREAEFGGTVGGMNALIYLPLLLMPLQADAKKSEPNIQLFRQDSAEQRDERQRRLEPWKQQFAAKEQLARRAKSGIVKPKLLKDVDVSRPQMAFKSKAIKDQFILQANADLAKSKKLFADFQGAGLPPFIMVPLSVGQVGTLKAPDNPAIEIVQVIDKENMLAKIWFAGHGGRVGERVLVWVRGILTEGVADENRFQATGDCIFYITGTTTYRSSFGTKTVMILEPMPDLVWQQFLLELKNSKP